MNFLNALLDNQVFNSVKEWANQPKPKNFNSTKLSNKKLFLSKENMDNVITTMYNNHVRSGFITPIEEYQRIIPKLMRKWAIKKNIDSFEMLGSGVEDYLNIIDFTNDAFIRDHYDMMILTSPLQNSLPDVNPRYPTVQVGLKDEYVNTIQRKNLTDLLASDYNSIDVWDRQSIYEWNPNFRLNNKFTKDKISRHVRNYADFGSARNFDGEIDGLRNTIETASRDNNHIRGYGIDYEKFMNSHTDDRYRNRYVRF